ncbi:unnamed protein product [Pleuronectes platessa]|uniref:Uncharacterized protein n=1 Tax=Pleuronectes platessa TaxID=8262 RepID=A0A9N7Z294_PLEPL|nr:unnamed protein product [Pleuronectes platessa]
MVADGAGGSRGTKNPVAEALARFGRGRTLGTHFRGRFSHSRHHRAALRGVVCGSTVNNTRTGGEAGECRQNTRSAPGGPAKPPPRFDRLKRSTRHRQRLSRRGTTSPASRSVTHQHNLAAVCTSV